MRSESLVYAPQEVWRRGAEISWSRARERARERGCRICLNCFANLKPNVSA